MSETPFDAQVQVRRQVQGLPQQAQVTFATACAQRLLPAYELFHRRTGRGDVPAIERALDTLWRVASGKERAIAPGEVDYLFSLVPRSREDDWIKEYVYAHCALDAAALAGRASLGVPDAAADAAEEAIDLADFVVLREVPAPGGSVTPEIERKIMEAPLMRLEVEAQARDLDALSRAGADPAAAAAEARERARVDGERWRALLEAHPDNPPGG
jgi:Protein of unknown function (DUF416)